METQNRTKVFLTPHKLFSARRWDENCKTRFCLAIAVLPDVDFLQNF